MCFVSFMMIMVSVRKIMMIMKVSIMFCVGICDYSFEIVFVLNVV